MSHILFVDLSLRSLFCLAIDKEADMRVDHAAGVKLVFPQAGKYQTIDVCEERLPIRDCARWNVGDIEMSVSGCPTPGVDLVTQRESDRSGARETSEKRSAIPSRESRFTL